MAGIGFEIKRVLERGTMSSVLQAYGFAGLISAGPWVLSVLGVLLIGLLSQQLIAEQYRIVQFLVSITWMMACSLTLTGLLTLLFTRFIADRVYEDQEHIILPNLFGAIWLTSIVSATLATLALLFLFDESFIYELLMLANFVVLCNLWIVVIFLSSMKAYMKILGLFFVGYSIAVLSAIPLSRFGISGLLLGTLLGHGFLVFSFCFTIIREYRSDHLLAFDFLKRENIFPSLALTGLFFYLGVWLDKFIFWLHPSTSEQIIGPLRASIIYDLPIFLAYLSIIPGMAVFLVRMEADFARAHASFYGAIEEGASLGTIRQYKNQMVSTARRGIYEIFKVQGITVVLLLLWGKEILQLVGISPLYARLFYVDVVAVSMQVLFLSILNVFFYLDSRRTALLLCSFFMVSNGILTWLTIQWGASFYGYGYAISISLSSLIGLSLLSTQMQRLEYETFMLRNY